jgi:hypothetical protein
MFSDYMMLIVSGKSLHDVEVAINHDLSNVNQWLCAYKLSLRGSPCKNRPLEFRKITEFLHTFCVEEVIHKMNKKR